MAGGFLDPSYLKTLPNTVVTFGRAAARLTAEKIRHLPKLAGSS
jgi:hypothetical protein